MPEDDIENMMTSESFALQFPTTLSSSGAKDAIFES